MSIDLIGEEILGYRVVELVGEGGMATVWRAEHNLLKRNVAIKVLDPLLARDSDLVQRFIDEAQIQIDLRHQNIVAIENFSSDPLAMVMEYVEGRTLDEMIGREVGPIPVDKALPLMIQVLEAIGLAHSKGVVHRDLKPANILVTTDDMVKVMDFGIAKILGGSRLTRTGTSMGTAAYMSPEQIKGAKDVDERSDIYSLGITFYEMLAGRTPFEGSSQTESDFEIRMAQVQQEPPDPRTFYPAIPDSVVEVVLKALSKEPAERHQNIDELRAELNGATTGDVTVRASFESAVPDRSSSLNRLAPEERSSVVSNRREELEPAVLDASPTQEDSNSTVPSEPRRRSEPEVPTVVDEPDEPDLYYPDEPEFDSGELQPPPIPAWDSRIPAREIRVENALIREERPKPEIECSGFALIPPGNFEMGSPEDEEGRDADERLHQVSISRYFAMRKTPVTQGDWRALMRTSPPFPRGDDYPIEWVSWYDAVAYCNALSREHGYPSAYVIADEQGSPGDEGYVARVVFRGTSAPGFRLPTEAEWEYACRADTAGNWYGELDEVAWFDANSEEVTQPVGQKKPNAWGLHDTLGNVWEWCHDLVEPYPTKPVLDPTGARTGTDRIVRGGSWLSSARDVRAANRRRLAPGHRGLYLGFRPVMTVQE